MDEVANSSQLAPKVAIFLAIIGTLNLRSHEMKRFWGELFPGDLVEHLEFLHSEALDLMRRLRAKRNQMQLSPGDALRDEAQEFFKRVRDKDDILTVARGTRILRFGAGEVWGLDPSADRPSLENSIAWVDRVIQNIEEVLDTIDRKRILWWTLIAAGAAAIVASLAFFTLLLDVVRTALRM